MFGDVFEVFRGDDVNEVFRVEEEAKSFLKCGYSGNSFLQDRIGHSAADYFRVFSGFFFVIRPPPCIVSLAVVSKSVSKS